MRSENHRYANFRKLNLKDIVAIKGPVNIKLQELQGGDGDESCHFPHDEVVSGFKYVSMSLVCERQAFSKRHVEQSWKITESRCGY